MTNEEKKEFSINAYSLFNRFRPYDTKYSLEEMRKNEEG